MVNARIHFECVLKNNCTRTRPTYYDQYILISTLISEPRHEIANFQCQEKTRNRTGGRTFAFAAIESAFTGEGVLGLGDTSLFLKALDSASPTDLILCYNVAPSHASIWYPLVPPHSTLPCLHIAPSHASTWYPPMPPHGTLPCLHMAPSHASTWHPPMPPHGTLSCLHMAPSHASTWHNRLDPVTNESRTARKGVAKRMLYRKGACIWQVILLI